MGIPKSFVLKKRLDEMNKEFQEKYNLPLQFIEHEPRKSSILFEYFVFYNMLLAYNPDEIIEICLNQRSGPTYLPLPAKKHWKTVSRMGMGLRPSGVVRRDNMIVSVWFNKPLTYFRKGKEVSIIPDIVIREGYLRVKEDYSSAKFWLFKEDQMIVECGISDSYLTLTQEKGYEILESTEWEGKKIYLKFKKEFIHPPLIIECKGFGAVLGNIQRYSSYGKNVVVVSPEKLYEPKAENIHILNLGKQLDNLELREKLIPFLKLVK